MSRIVRDISEAKALVDGIRASRREVRRMGRITETTFGARVVAKEFLGRPAFVVETYTVNFDPSLDMHIASDVHTQKALEWETETSSRLGSPMVEGERFPVVY